MNLPETEPASPETVRRIQHECAVLSGLPGYSNYEQRAEIEARMERGELMQVGETWYERVDFDNAAEREKAENPLRVVNAGPPPLTREISNAIVRAFCAAKVPSQMLLELIERGVFAPPVAEEPDKIVAPWNVEIATALNAFQEREEYHPFTCPNDHLTPGEAKLVATLDGWVCSRAPACGYTQNWAHSFMAGEDVSA